MIDRREFLRLSAAGAALGLGVACSPSSPQQDRRKAADFALEAIESDIDLGGRTVRTWAYGNQVPGKEIRLRKGERLRAEVANKLPTDTTIHWHGIALRNDMDGVPVLTQPPILSGQQFVYDFVVPDAGTYFYHSHVGTQLDRGLYGALIVEDPDERADYDDELIVMLDDWIDGTGTNPDQVLTDLKKSGMDDMPMMGQDAGVTPTSPLGADGGDVKVYPYYLVNGRVNADPQVVNYRAGQRVRLRIINAGSDTAFRVGVANTPLTVTHTDGYPVVARQTNSVIIGMGERVDATITIGSSVPLIAAAEGKNGYAQLNIRVEGARSRVNVANFVAALRNSTTLDTAQLPASPGVRLAQRDPDHTIDLRLAGPVNGYNWPITGKLYNPPNDGYPVAPGQRLRIRYINESMMFHPMHLHGHTFQVKGPGGSATRKDTVLVPPMQTVETIFDTNNAGRWLIHCHNTYHLESGMATFIYYT
ncbi:multicopper oxidase family protein [Mycolicibacterium sp. GF69]|uniref:multicopper oxidase family protein n=1 Tax=Mycolicibacterium sp. GF69 TaxID=2267251 RepID=UPI000DCD5BBC|nr:multicopper oxidase family protein [Mycolicibacterium sp. GF69]MBY0288870.1 multicopper oxidase family protein [Mycobacteriaceae bacterium]RAV07375.1 multicopper oxidase family protein [Mycolicibacterium sp. GF69]